jgi:hypothetical protein
MRTRHHWSPLWAFWLLLVPTSTLAQSVTILQPGGTNFLAHVGQHEPSATIDSDFVAIDNESPGSGTVSASGSELTNADEFGSATGSGAAGLTGNVFSLHWTGHAYTTSTPPVDFPILYALSGLCGPQDHVSCYNDELRFQLSAPTRSLSMQAERQPGRRAGAGGTAQLYSAVSPRQVDRGSKPSSTTISEALVSPTRRASTAGSRPP